MLSAAGTGLLFWVVCTGPSVPLCLASASSWRHGPSSWWAGEWRVGEIQCLLSLTRACLCGLQSLIAVRRVSLNWVHIFSEVAESFSGSILSARSVMALLSWSQSAFLYSGMSLGTCFLFCRWMITSQCTASWSEGPGRTCILGMSCGLLGMIRSRVLSRCVGSWTSCSRP